MNSKRAPRSMADVIRTPRFWLAPILVVSALMAFLAALYLGGILNPKDNLHDFPVAVVNLDQGDTTGAGDDIQSFNFGNDITEALVENIDADKVSLRVVGPAQAQSLLSSGSVYGSIVIPSDFTKRSLILATASVVPGDVEKPIITVYTNPRAGSFSVSLLQSITTPALGAVNENLGTQLGASIQEKLGDSGTEVSGAARLTLANPVNVITSAHDPLPDGTGAGLSAFYYALLLVLAGFTGATIVNALVDGLLGFAPTEFGPRYIHKGPTSITRFQTLLVKWLIMVVLAHIISALYLWISMSLGMPSPHSLGLWMYGAFAITAVGITALSVMAAFGTIGLLINLIIFVILALPSSGGTIPLEATPSVYAWLAQFEPMHQIFLGVRSILYFNARWSAGLQHSLVMTGLGMVAGLILGVVVTRIYDRRGFYRTENREEGYVIAQNGSAGTETGERQG